MKASKYSVSIPAKSNAYTHANIATMAAAINKAITLHSGQQATRRTRKRA